MENDEQALANAYNMQYRLMLVIFLQKNKLKNTNFKGGRRGRKEGFCDDNIKVLALKNVTMRGSKLVQNCVTSFKVILKKIIEYFLVQI